MLPFVILGQLFVDFDYLMCSFENFQWTNYPMLLVIWTASPWYRRHLHYYSTNSKFQELLLPLHRFDLTRLDKPHSDQLTYNLGNSRDNGCILQAFMDNDLIYDLHILKMWFAIHKVRKQLNSLGSRGREHRYRQQLLLTQDLPLSQLIACILSLLLISVKYSFLFC